MYVYSMNDWDVREYLEATSPERNPLDYGNNPWYIIQREREIFSFVQDRSHTLVEFALLHCYGLRLDT